ncbi:MAG: ATP-binding protein [Treponema sp.]|nr:ATP-binding protein [Treponema sp.]
MSTKLLKLRFEGEDLFFDQLSDGEKMLFGLYAVYTALGRGTVNTVLIDEPDNYISLQELQPWLLSMGEIADVLHQIIIISHNGEIIDSNPSTGYFFWRDNHRSPARVGPLDVPQGLTAREALARGWVNPSGPGEE